MKSLFVLAIILASSIMGIFAQTQLTNDDYKRANDMLTWHTRKLVYHSPDRFRMLDDGRFWYNIYTADGQKSVIYNPATDERTLGDSIQALVELPPRAPFNWLEIKSPDGKKAVFIEDWNLWMKDLESGAKTQLTTDGVKDFGYATDNAGWRHSDRPIVLWSHDSKKIVTYKQDQRHVNDMYLVTTNVGAPTLKSWKYPLPEDERIIEIHRVIIDVEDKSVLPLQVDPDPRRATGSDDISITGSFDDNHWSEDNATLAFVSSSRDHKIAQLRIADVKTGEVKDIMREEVETQFESGQGVAINWRYLANSNEILWYSERDNWGHLYLYDATTGALKNQITKGDFVILRLRHVDEENRKLYFDANGREEGRDPYFTHFYSVNFDGSDLKLLTPDNGNHRITLAEDHSYFIDKYSQPDVPPVTKVYKMDGTLINTIEEADISALEKSGWTAPVPFSVKSDDGQFDLYGLMFTPKNLDPNKKYPVVNYIYPGPQSGSVGSRSFLNSRDHQAVAELGFIVVSLDGSCNPFRSKAFHDACYGFMGTNTLPDQVNGLKQLAEKYNYLDLDKVGVWGRSGGGFATVDAMFSYPDFYKVGVALSGNHDNRNYEDDWGERYIGLVDGDNYAKQANAINADKLKGKLLIGHGNMDDNVPPYNSLLVVDALIKANKDFDLLIVPHARHGFGRDSGYVMRRRWDYFVKHLMGAEPPKEYQITF